MLSILTRGGTGSRGRGMAMAGLTLREAPAALLVPRSPVSQFRDPQCPPPLGQGVGGEAPVGTVSHH